MASGLVLPRPVGFVLGGGGSLGAVQVGMLRALTELEVFPDLVVGTAAGRIPSPPATLAEALLFSAMLTMRMQSALEAPLAAARVPVVYLPGPVLIEGGYQAARPFLESLDIAGPGLYGPVSRC